MPEIEEMCKPILNMKQESPDNKLEAGVIVVVNKQIRQLNNDDYDILHSIYGIQKKLVNSFLKVDLYKKGFFVY